MNSSASYVLPGTALLTIKSPTGVSIFGSLFERGGERRRGESRERGNKTGGGEGRKLEEKRMREKEGERVSRGEEKGEGGWGRRNHLSGGSRVSLPS